MSKSSNEDYVVNEEDCLIDLEKMVNEDLDTSLANIEYNSWHGWVDYGEKVRIREWDDMVEEFGIDKNGNIKNNFLASMRHLCGLTGTVWKADDFEVFLSYKDKSIYDPHRITMDMVDVLDEYDEEYEDSDE